MNINAIIAGKFLSNWYFPAMRSRLIAARPVGRETPAKSCLLFAVDLPTHPACQAKGFHLHVPLPQVVFPEVDLDRAVCLEKIQEHKSDIAKAKAGIIIHPGIGRLKDIEVRKGEPYGHFLVSFSRCYMDRSTGLCVT